MMNRFAAGLANLQGLLSGGGRRTLRARVVSPDDVESPVTGLRAAAFWWDVDVSERVVKVEVDNYDGVTRLEEEPRAIRLGGGALGASLALVTTGGQALRVVPTEAGFSTNADGPPAPLERPLPPSMADALAPPPEGVSAMRYRERFLRYGDVVTVSAVFAKESDDGGVVWRARPEAGPVTITESIASLSQSYKGLIALAVILALYLVPFAYAHYRHPPPPPRPSVANSTECAAACRRLANSCNEICDAEFLCRVFEGECPASRRALLADYAEESRAGLKCLNKGFFLVPSIQEGWSPARHRAICELAGEVVTP